MITEFVSLYYVSFAAVKLHIIATSMLLTARLIACSIENKNDKDKINKN